MDGRCSRACLYSRFHAVWPDELLLTLAQLSAALVSLWNARHLFFYGLSMLEPFKIMGKLKPYMIFSLSDIPMFSKTIGDR